MKYNIATTSPLCELMLGCSVDTYAEAEAFLPHYTDKVGKPYPNGKGVYPDRGYHIVRVSEDYAEWMPEELRD